MQAGGNHGGSTNARATSQRLTFHPAFKRAHADVIRAQHLNKIHVRAAWAEIRVPPDFRADLHDHRVVSVGTLLHRVRHAGVERMNRRVPGGERHGLVEL